MKKYLFFVFFLFILLLPTQSFSAEVTNFENEVLPAETNSTPAQNQKDSYIKGKVITILEEGEKEIELGVKQKYQKVEIQILDGAEKNKKIIIDHGGLFAISDYQRVKKGDTVVLVKPANSPKEDFYYIVDRYRVHGILFLIGIFFALAIFFGRKKGITSLFGLVFSSFIIFYFIIPYILKGHNAFLVSIIGASLVLLVSLYLSHGFNKRTSVALLSSFITLLIAVIIDLVFVYVAKISGTGSEEAFYLQFDNDNINLKGVLLGGIIIGVLGILDDVTTTQTAAVEEIHKANPSLSFAELYKRGLSVGTEHIASLINTLVLAYVGVSFPLILLYSSRKGEDIWFILNSSFVAEELIRILVGSVTLILTIPLTTFLAAYFFRGNKKNS